MAEENDNIVKLKGVDGIDTAKGDDPKKDIRVPLGKAKSEIAYHEPENKQEALEQGLAGVGFSSTIGLGIKGGTNFTVNNVSKELYTSLDLAKALPDKNERDKYIAEHGSRMVKLMDSNEWGIRFNHEIADYAAFKAKKYDVQLKKFMDDLDANQGFLKEARNTVGKLLGRTITAVGGLIPLTYGLGKGLFTWDSQNIFNNGMFDAWETMDEAIDRKTAVYGGSDYYSDDKGFFARMISHPMKSINADVAPAVSFVTGAVLTEMAATAITAATLGAGAPALAANTARLAAQATNMFSKSYKVLRGLDALSDMNNMRKIVELTQIYKNGIGTVTSMVRSAGYESSLIARDTYDRTLQQSKLNYIQNNSNLQTEAQQLSAQGLSDEEIIKRLEEKIPQSALTSINKSAEASSELAWFTNVPLVGFSNMIQFTKTFNSGFKIGQKLESLNPFTLTGTVLDKSGKAVSRMEAASLGRKIVGYSSVGLKGGITEGFEEYAQGVIERGYSDYFSSQFTNDTVKQSASFISAMANASRQYVNTTEGQDSMTIGALMGMLGIGLPFKIDEETGKVKKGFQWQGGVYQEIKDLKKQVEKDKVNAELRNSNRINPILKNNFENMMKNITIQSEMDETLEKGDVFNYKNKEYEQLHSYVSNRYQNGIEDTIHQDLDALQELPLDSFNEQFAYKGFEFTEESRKTALDKTRNNVDNIVTAHKHVDAMYSDSKMFMDFWRKNYKGIQDPLQLTEAIKEQMTFLYGSVLNLEKREKELTDQIRSKSNGNVNTSAVDNIHGTVTHLKEDQTLGTATNVRDVYDQQMNDWKEKDPVGYSLYGREVFPIARDLARIKQRKVEVAAMYDTLFTNKGAKQYVDIYQQLLENRAKAIKEQALAQTEEAINKAKSSDTVAAQAKNEESLTGNTQTVTAKVDQELKATDEALKKLVEEHPDANNVQDLSELVAQADSEAIIEQLQKSPALFKQILDRLEAQGKIIPGLTNVDQLDEVIAEDGSNLAKILNAFEEIQKEFQEFQVPTTEKLNFADPKDAEQPNPSVEESTTLASKYGTKTQEQIENSIFQGGSNVTNNSVIPVLHDRKLEKGALVRNPKTGKWEVWTDNKGQTTDQQVDTKKVNSPDFLNNKDLKENERLATFKISENDWNKTERGVEDIAIDIYHGDVFIGRLPAYKKGMPVHLLALRKAVMEQEVISEIDNQISNTVVNTKLTKEEADWLYDNLKLITKTYKSYNLAESVDTELKKPLIIGDTKVTHIKPDAGGSSSIIFERPSGKWMVKISEKNGKQRLDLYQWKDVNVKGEFSFYATNESTGNDLKNIEKAGLLSLINDIYKDTNVPYPGSREAAFELSNSLQQKYNLKRSYKDIINELKQPTTNTIVSAIEENFNIIIAQLLAAKVNVFFNEEFKKECK
jgi:hypothetical protein